MMNKLIFTLILTLALGVSAQIHAKDTCGGTLQHTDDCVGNGRSWHISCCPDGYRVQGVAYNDIEGQDHADAVSAVCRHIARGNDMMPSDFGKNPKKYVCNNNEVMAGIYSKDVMTNAGGKRDSLDGVSAICQHPGNTNLRVLPNKDLDSGRHGREMTTLLPKRVVGVAYKKLEKGSSDRADCVTIITK